MGRVIRAGAVLGMAAALGTARASLSAGFTLAGTTAVERLGPRLGGLVASVPQLAVVSLIFFAIEQGLGFAADRQAAGIA